MRILVILAIIAIVCSVSAAPTISAGTEEWGSRWYAGTGVPPSSLGSVNDFYMDDGTGNIYNKTDTGWNFLVATSGVDTSAFYFLNGSRILTGDMDVSGYNITNTTEPILGSHVANKTYVDTAIAGISIPNTTYFYFLNGSRALTGVMDAGGFNLSNLLDPVVAQDAATKNYVDTQIAAIPVTDTSYFYFLNGSRILTGKLDAGGYNLTNVSTPVGTADAATKGYVDGVIPNTSYYYFLNGSRSLTGDMNVSNYNITYVGAPTNGGDATNKTYVDTEITDAFESVNTNMYKNAIINGNFDVWQRGTTYDAATTPANSDDTYLVDMWVLLSDGNDIADVSQTTTVPVGSKYALKSLVATQNKKWGFVYLMENVDSMKLDDQYVSLSFQAKSSGIDNIRAGVLSWSSTADSVTSDVVSAWEAEGTNPTLAANWQYENVPANLALTGSYVRYEIENIAIDTASMANVAVFIWVDDGDAGVNDELYLSQVQLNVGTTALDFSPAKTGEELTLCKRYYERWVASSQFTPIAVGANEATTYAYAPYSYTVEKRSIPSTISVSNVAHFQVRPMGAAAIATTNMEFSSTGTKGTLIKASVAAGLTVGQTGFVRSSTTSAWIGFSSEL